MIIQYFLCIHNIFLTMRHSNLNFAECKVLTVGDIYLLLLLLKLLKCFLQFSKKMYCERIFNIFILVFFAHTKDFLVNICQKACLRLLIGFTHLDIVTLKANGFYISQSKNKTTTTLLSSMLQWLCFVLSCKKLKGWFFSKLEQYKAFCQSYYTKTSYVAQTLVQTLNIILQRLLNAKS